MRQSGAKRPKTQGTLGLTENHDLSKKPAHKPQKSLESHKANGGSKASERSNSHPAKQKEMVDDDHEPKVTSKMQQELLPLGNDMPSKADLTKSIAERRKKREIADLKKAE